jgi:hypothetical protein
MTLVGLPAADHLIIAISLKSSLQASKRVMACLQQVIVITEGAMFFTVACLGG